MQEIQPRQRGRWDWTSSGKTSPHGRLPAQQALSDPATAIETAVMALVSDPRCQRVVVRDRDTRPASGGRLTRRAP